MPRIAIATENHKGLEDRVAERFARSPTLTIIDVGTNGEIKNVKIIDNPGAQASSGAAVKTIQALVNEGVEIVVGPAFGPNAQAILYEMNIKAVTASPGTSVREAVEKALKEAK